MSIDNWDLYAICESLLFVSDKPLTVEQVVASLEREHEEALERAEDEEDERSRLDKIASAQVPDAAFSTSLRSQTATSQMHEAAGESVTLEGFETLAAEGEVVAQAAADQAGSAVDVGAEAAVVVETPALAEAADAEAVGAPAAVQIDVHSDVQVEAQASEPGASVEQAGALDATQEQETDSDEGLVVDADVSDDAVDGGTSGKRSIRRRGTNVAKSVGRYNPNAPDADDESTANVAASEQSTAPSEREVAGTDVLASEAEVAGTDVLASEVEVAGTEVLANEVEVAGTEVLASEAEAAGTKVLASEVAESEAAADTAQSVGRAVVDPSELGAGMGFAADTDDVGDKLSAAAVSALVGLADVVALSGDEPAANKKRGKRAKKPKPTEGAEQLVLEPGAAVDTAPGDASVDANASAATDAGAGLVADEVAEKAAAVRAENTPEAVRKRKLRKDLTRLVEDAFSQLMSAYADPARRLGRGLQLVNVAGAYQLRTNPECAAFVRHHLQVKPTKLSRAQVETLAIIAYRQPVTRPEIEHIRGVDCGAGLKILLDRRLIRILGKKEEVGRPLLYGTTKEFLEFFNLGSLLELPTLREFQELSDEHRKKIDEEIDADAPLGDLRALAEGQPKFVVDDTELLADVDQALQGAKQTAQRVAEATGMKSSGDDDVKAES